MTNPFSLSARFYNHLYSDKDYKEEAEYILTLVSELMSNERLNILEFGSGTGIHSSHFGSQGHRVHGLEISKEMLASCCLTHPNVTYEHFDISQPYISTLSYDIVLSLFHVINYQTSIEALLQVFQNAYNSLRPGGLFIFDSWFTPGVHTDPPAVRSKVVKTSSGSTIKRIAKPTTDTVNSIVNIEFTFFEDDAERALPHNQSENHKLKHLSLTEVELLSRLSGFELVACEEWFTRLELSPSTWYATFTLKK